MNKKLIAKFILIVLSLQFIFEPNILTSTSKMGEVQTSSKSDEKAKEEPSRSTDSTDESLSKVKDIAEITAAGLVVIIAIVGVAKKWWSPQTAVSAITLATQDPLAAAVTLGNASKDQEIGTGIKNAVVRAQVYKLSFANFETDIWPLLKKIPGIEINEKTFKEAFLEVTTGNIDNAIRKLNIKIDAADLKNIKDAFNKQKKFFDLASNPEALKEFVEQSRLNINSKIKAIDKIGENYKIDSANLKALKDEFSKIEKGGAETVDLRKLIDLGDRADVIHKEVVNNAARQQISKAQENINAIKKNLVESGRLKDSTTLNSFESKLKAIDEVVKKGQEINIENLNKLSTDIVTYHNKVAVETNPYSINPFKTKVEPLQMPHTIPLEVPHITPHESPIHPPVR